MGWLPAFQYWISGTALFLAGSFAFSLAVGLIGIKEMVSKKVLGFLMAASIILSFLAWRTAAQQESDSSSSDERIGALQDAVNGEKADTKRQLDAQSKQFEGSIAGQSKKLDEQNGQLTKQ